MNSILPKTSQGYFFERNNFPKSSGISILSARYNIRTSPADIKTFTHPFWVLDYSHGNCGSCRIGKRNNSWLPRPSGYMHLYKPNTKYWEDTSSGELPLQSSFITFYGGEELDLLKHVNNGEGFGRFLDKTGKSGDLFVKAASEAAKGGERSYWRVMSEFYGIIDLIHSAQAVESGRGNCKTQETVVTSTTLHARNGLKNGGRGLSEPQFCNYLGNEKVIADPDNGECRNREGIFIETVRKFLQERVDKKVGIADLARRMNASVSTISHKYRELTGETPMKTLTIFRINAVKNMLAKGESIKYIASQTRFCDEFHLSKVFKKATGTSPSSYLKRFPEN